MTGASWCPKQTDFTSLRQVADPHRKDTLTQMLNEAMSAALPNVEASLRPKTTYTLRHLDTHPPDSEWLINVLSPVAPDIEIFAKGYTKPTEPRENEERMIINNSFFNGIPELNKKGKTLRLRGLKDKAQH